MIAETLTKNELSQDEMNKKQWHARKEQERFKAASAKRSEEREGSPFCWHTASRSTS